MKIEIKNVSMAYKKNNFVIKDLSLDIESPEMIGLVGPNGAGKTTLMKLMVGQLMPTKGSIFVDGKDLYKNDKYLKSRLGYLPQGFGLYDELTVYEYLDYIACLKGVKDMKKQRIEECINDAGLLDKMNSRISSLSGGQKQRVGIAQALLGKPEVFIVDEPTVGLDPEERIKFRNLFSKNAGSKIVILSTHIIDDIQSICSRLIIINKGRILFDGTPQKLIKDAEGHAAVLEIKGRSDINIDDSNRVTSRIFTSDGILYRLVGDDFPAGSSMTQPTLEDAYIYCIMKGEQRCGI